MVRDGDETADWLTDQIKAEIQASEVSGGESFDSVDEMMRRLREEDDSAPS